MGILPTYCLNKRLLKIIIDWKYVQENARCNLRTESRNVCGSFPFPSCPQQRFISPQTWLFAYCSRRLEWTLQAASLALCNTQAFKFWSFQHLKERESAGAQGGHSILREIIISKLNCDMTGLSRLFRTRDHHQIGKTGNKDRYQTCNYICERPWTQ